MLLSYIFTPTEGPDSDNFILSYVCASGCSQEAKIQVGQGLVESVL